jgi:hypothetical protein
MQTELIEAGHSYWVLLDQDTFGLEGRSLHIFLKKLLLFKIWILNRKHKKGKNNNIW